MLVRVTPDVRRRHPREDLHRPGELEVRLLDGPGAERARAGRARSTGLRLLGVHAHIGSQLLGADAVRPRRGGAGEPRRAARSGTWGAASGSRYTEDQQPPPTIEEYVEAIVTAARAERGARRAAC